jgi:hypothetical protein
MWAKAEAEPWREEGELSCGMRESWASSVVSSLAKWRGEGS